MTSCYLTHSVNEYINNMKARITVHESFDSSSGFFYISQWVGKQLPVALLLSRVLQHKNAWGFLTGKIAVL